jgi:hypothetical protein
MTKTNFLKIYTTPETQSQGGFQRIFKQMFVKKFTNRFGKMKFTILYLLQFFQQHLSRKAEGNGPMKP